MRAAGSERVCFRRREPPVFGVGVANVLWHSVGHTDEKSGRCGMTEGEH